MNPHLLAYICLFATVGGIVAAFMDKINWGTAGIIFVATIVAAILNGFLLARRIKKQYGEIGQ